MNADNHRFWVSSVFICVHGRLNFFYEALMSFNTIKTADPLAQRLIGGDFLEGETIEVDAQMNTDKHRFGSHPCSSVFIGGSISSTRHL